MDSRRVDEESDPQISPMTQISGFQIGAICEICGLPFSVGCHWMN
jgi:hypothetical protein